MGESSKEGSKEMVCRIFSITVFMAASVLHAQPDPRLPEILTQETTLTLDSGYRASDQPGLTLAAFEVTRPGAAWLRLQLGECSLAGTRAEGGAMVRITSVLDGDEQVLDAEGLAQWGGTSAYFNGDSVIVELVSGQVAGSSRLAIGGVTSQARSGIATRSICGSTDDRIATAERANARLLPAGCTAWIFTDTNHTLLSAGHCGVSASSVIQFNVPLSNSDGTLVHPPARDQYAADPASVQASSLAVGDDWAYFGVYPNSNTGLTPYQAQAEAYDIAESAPPVDGQRVRITGFGTVAAPVPRSLNQTQRAGVGDYVFADSTTLRYDADTTGGNSGSPVYLLDSRTAVGIHTNAGCDAGGGSNAGTAIQSPGLQTALANPRGVCGSGAGAVWGSLFVVGDLANNFGAIASENASFGQLSQIGPSMQGLAYDWGNDRLWAIDLARVLYALDPDSGVSTSMGELVGVDAPLTEAINGLGFDPWTGWLYGVSQVSGQLYRIDPQALSATRVGAAGGAGIGGVDYDPDSRTLFGIRGAASEPTLVTIDVETGTQRVVGVLGAGNEVFAGLAYNGDDGQIYTIAARTGGLYRVSPETGLATLVGSTGGAFGSGFGLAARTPPPACARLDYNRDGNVDVADIDAMIQAIGSGVWAVTPDLNRDGATDAGDIQTLISGIAGECP